MSEITVIPLFPTAAPRRHLIDPVAFFAALVGGPLLASAITFWMLLIPVFALPFGLPFYLVLGTPLLLWHLSRHAPSYGRICGLAFLAALAVPLILAAAQAGLTGRRNMQDLAGVYLLFGPAIGPIWAAGFTWLYIRLRRRIYQSPI